MTQTLLPFTFLNSTFPLPLLSMPFPSSENVLQCEKVVFLRKFSFCCLPCSSQLHAAVSVLKEELISDIYKFQKQRDLTRWDDHIRDSKKRWLGDKLLSDILTQKVEVKAITVRSRRC